MDERTQSLQDRPVTPHPGTIHLVRLAWGGQEAWAEMNSMVFEKIAAATEATATLLTGGTPDDVVARYREHVAANTQRLRA
ncbi:hypothetical protein [Methylorubrum aminovorans]